MGFFLFFISKADYIINFFLSLIKENINFTIYRDYINTNLTFLFDYKYDILLFLFLLKLSIIKIKNYKYSNYYNIILIILSAFLVGFSQPSYMWGQALTNKYSNFIGYISFIPLFIALENKKSLNFFKLSNFIFTTISVSLTYYWLANFKDFSIYVILGAIIGYLILNHFLFIFLFQIFKISSNKRPFFIASLFIVYEYLTSNGFLAFPWNLAGYVIDNHYIIQIADIGGAYLLSFLIYLFQAILFEALYFLFFKKPSLKKDYYNISVMCSQFFLIGLFFAISFIYGYLRLEELKNKEGPSKELDVLMIQQNSDPWTEGPLNSLKKAMRLTSKGIAKSGNIDLIMYSESSLYYPYNYSYFYDEYPADLSFKDFIKKINKPIFSGASILDVINGDKVYYNASILISPDGELNDYYTKQHMVPYGEVIPFYDYPILKNIMDKIGIEPQWFYSNKDNLLKVKNKKGEEILFFPSICFEDSFAILSRKAIQKGADVILNVTNNSWSKTFTAQIQHHKASLLRAIENRRVLIKSTNSGLTTIIDTDGTMLQALPMYKDDYLYDKVILKHLDVITFYNKFGDFYIYFIILYLFINILIYNNKYKLKDDIIIINRVEYGGSN